MSRVRGKSLIDEEREDKLNLIAVCCLVVLVCLFTFLTGLSYRLKQEHRRSLVTAYSCESTLEQVVHTNSYATKYYINHFSNKYEKCFVSTVGVQGALFKYYEDQGVEQPELFAVSQNGCVTWRNSGRLLSDPCLTSLYYSDLPSYQALCGRLTTLTDGAITGLGETEPPMQETDIISVCSLNLTLDEVGYSVEQNMLYSLAPCPYKVTDTYRAVKLSSADGEYTVYLIEGSLEDFSVDGFDSQIAGVAISPCTWQTSGRIDNFAQMLASDESLTAVMVAQFGFDTSNCPDTSPRSDVMSWPEHYTVMVMSSTTGLILGLGKR